MLFGRGGSVTSVACSRDGQRFAAGGVDGIVKVWDARNRKLLQTLRGHTRAVWGLAFSPDSKHLASASGDPSDGHLAGDILIRDAATGQVIHTLPSPTGGVHSIAYSPNGNYLVSGGFDQPLRVWDTTTGNEVATLPAKAAINDWATIAVSAWSLVVQSQCCQSLVSGQVPYLLGVTELVDTAPWHWGQVWGVVFSPDGKRIASASFDGSVRVWDVASGKEVLKCQGHGSVVWSVAFSPDGVRIASASDDLTVRVWDVNTGKEVAKLTGHTFPPYSVTFSPDGKWLATASGHRWEPDHPGEVKVWDVNTTESVITLRCHSGGFLSAAFSADGKQLVAAGTDGVVRVWDTTPWQATLEGPAKAP
jgi:WD40 repeat protein